jgi:hypothetical protein
VQETTPAEKYLINLASENEYQEHFNEEKEKQNIQTSTFIAFTVDFELQKLISNCNSSVTRMTPCLEEAYDNLFGSEYNLGRGSTLSKASRSKHQDLPKLGLF